jgi:hypothetical protein
MSNSTPAPFLVSPAWTFGGDDGAWSTFQVAVGTPPQWFQLLPSTALSETWVPIPDGCSGILSGLSDCGALRGVEDINGTASSGFLTNASSTWDNIGIYGLAAEQNLFGSGDNGLYGIDTITLQPISSGARPQNVSLQTVAGYASLNYWIGALGLGPASSNFSVQGSGSPSLMATLAGDNLIPSLSFGYSAGASYESDYGSLVLGGYDASRMDSTNLTVPLNGSDTQTLLVSLVSVTAENVLGGTRSLVTEGSLAMTIDSTVSQMWLPRSACDNFEEAFGLTYDGETDLYTINSTMHSQLQSLNPIVTFKIGPNDDSGSNTTNIKFPYSAFDLNASIPIYNGSTPYFPIRRAANESQYVLGRAFLQEAYIFVDWERQSLTVSQAVHQNSTSNIVPVLSPSDRIDDSTAGSGGGGLSTGAIAGIAVGVSLAVIIAVLLALLFVLRRRRKQRKLAVAKTAELDASGTQPQGAELDGKGLPGAEVLSSPIHEMYGDQKRSEAPDTPLVEMAGNVGATEMPDNEVNRDKKVPIEEPKRRSLYEMP